MGETGHRAKEFTNHGTEVGEESSLMLGGDICCFAGSVLCRAMDQHRNGAEGKEKGKIHLSFSPALSQHTLPLKLRDFVLFLRTSIFFIFIVL